MEAFNRYVSEIQVIFFNSVRINLIYHKSSLFSKAFYRNEKFFAIIIKKYNMKFSYFKANLTLCAE